MSSAPPTMEARVSTIRYISLARSESSFVEAAVSSELAAEDWVDLSISATATLICSMPRCPGDP